MLFQFQLTPSRRATLFVTFCLILNSHFNSRPHGGRRFIDGWKYQVRENFNSRPHGGRHRGCNGRLSRKHFNSRPHGGRREYEMLHQSEDPFQLTPSRRATLFPDICILEVIHFNSRPHGGRPIVILSIFHYLRISTHALTEGDSFFLICIGVMNISTHALTEGDPAYAAFPFATKPFQLTPSRRATWLIVIWHRITGISTHALTEGDDFVKNRRGIPDISTHALTEGDKNWTRSRMLLQLFQLTPSRRATKVHAAENYGNRTFQLTPSRRAT